MLQDQVEIDLNGEALVLDASGALFWPAERTLVAADLHFEKGSFYAFTGQMLPPYDTRTTLKRIDRLVGRYTPDRVIALGDSFHDRDAVNRLDAFERDSLSSLAHRTEWIWIAGNHDPLPPSWCGRAMEEVRIGRLIFRHEPSVFHARGEIAGHLHPCATVTRRGRSLRRRCFASDGHRMVLPAFGAYAGGLDIRDVAVRTLFPEPFRAYVLGTHRVYAIAA